jgi:hypothetical protein
MRRTSTPKLSSRGTDLGGAGLSSFDIADTLLFLGGMICCSAVSLNLREMYLEQGWVRDCGVAILGSGEREGAMGFVDSFSGP